MSFEISFLELAKNAGYHAQITSNESISLAISYKTLTKETITQKTSERKFGIRLEKDGKKSYRTVVDENAMSPKQLFEEMVILCEIASTDEAEQIPNISDSIEGSAVYFTESELENWGATVYASLQKELQTLVQQRGIAETSCLFDDLGIESLMIGGGISKKRLTSTYGANKSSQNSSTSVYIGFHGKIGEESNAEWAGHSSQGLLQWENEWTSQCIKKLYDTLTHSEEIHFDGENIVAFDRNISAELTGELLGFLSGYAMSEKMSPFTIESIDTSILPEWANIKNTTVGDIHGASMWYDENGITAVPELSIVENGKLANVFLNSASAKRLGKTAVGHSGSINISFSGNSSECTSHVVPSNSPNFGNGTRAFDPSTGVSFLCTGLAGTHTMESTTGNFALEGEGYEILKDGTVGNFIKRVGVSGNIRTLFKELVGHGNDYPIYGSLRIPTLICKNIRLSK